MSGGLTDLNINMKHLNCNKVTQLGGLFSGIELNEAHQKISVYNFTTNNTLDISGIASNSETGCIEFINDTVVSLDNASCVFKDSIYAGDVNVKKLFGIFDTSNAKRIDSMFCNAQIDGAIEMYGITFSRLLDAKNMFNCAEAGIICLENVKFPSTHIDYMFYELSTNTLVFNNVDFSETRVNSLADVFGCSHIDCLEIHPNCNWPNLRGYNRYDVLNLLFGRCEILRLRISEEDTDLITVVKNNNPYVEIEYI